MRVRIEAGTADLRLLGTILIDQLQTVDVGRITGAFGRLTPTELESVRLGLRDLLGEALNLTA
jgi:mRNA-degrading endonuclease toxin of MazEF toxin-antitoxin module